MILRGARVALNARESERLDVCVRRGRVHSLEERAASLRSAELTSFDFDGFLVLPGLINAHDHLEFNLFPRLGRGTYSNATAWANDIYRPDQFPIRQHLEVPKPVRLFWGGIKNLINGVTTVAHHNSYDANVFEQGFPIRVVKRFGWAHSIAFCTDLQASYRATPPGAPFIIHAGEGTDDKAHAELGILDQAGLVGPTSVIVHGVALYGSDIPLLKQRGVSLIWCPTSNLFTLGKTLSTEVLQSSIPIALGTDSALTAEGDLSDEIRVASRHTGLCRIYDMLTTQAANVLRLRHKEGSIRQGARADFIVVEDRGQAPVESLPNINPELVVVGGRIKLISVHLATSFRLRHPRRMHRIAVEGRGDWYIDCNIPELSAPAKWVLDDAFRLAGRRVECWTQ
jgi:cytosine/adenosine deaminase-related metal-dependent hydrolase